MGCPVFFSGVTALAVLVFVARRERAAWAAVAARKRADRASTAYGGSGGARTGRAGDRV